MTPMLSYDSVNKHFADKLTKKYDYYNMKVWECYYPELNDYCKYFFYYLFNLISLCILKVINNMQIYEKLYYFTKTQLAVLKYLG